MKKSILPIIFLFIGFLGFSSLQAQTLRGVVKDGQTGETLPGANVVVKGTTQGTVTDFDGQYSLSLPAGVHVIAVSFISYDTQEFEISIASGETLTRDVSMVSDFITFDEFVVIGYGSQKKRVVTGAIASVGAEEITLSPILRVEQALQGRTAGVQVTNLSGQPGEAPTVRIRGAGTTGNPEPLYIVDGMKVEGIDFLNPGDIESVDVLKDAASAAIYGARAANGVVLITTKSGTKGKMNITYSSYYGIQNAARTIPMLNAEQYMMLMNEGAKNANQTQPYDLNEIPRHNTNWQAELFQKNAPMTSHEIAVSGGSERSTYASSLSFFSQQGIIGGDKSQYDRITARLNSNHQVNDFIRVGNNLAYSHIIRRGIASNTSFNGAYSSALNLDPLTPLYEDSETELALPPYSNNPVVTDSEGRIYGISRILIGGEIVNPLALLETHTAETRVDKIVGNVFGEFEPIKGLVAKTSFGIDLAYVLNDSYRPLFFLNSAQNNTDITSVSKNINRYFTWQWENTLSYTRQMGMHNFSGLIGMSASKDNYEDLFGFNTGVPINDPNHVYINMATDEGWRAAGGAGHAAILSQFGRILYDYKSIYAVNVTLRRDGSSRFGPNNRFGIFPSLGLSWVMSEESFFPKFGWLDILKLRASWGVNGNERIGNYQFVSLMDFSRGYIFGGGREYGASPSFIENKDIRWEESEQIDIAIDFGAFNNRLTGTIDYYVKTTRGLLERIPIPAHVGNDPPFDNVGSVQNKGVEVSLNWRNQGKNFGYSLGLNGAYNQNKMTKIGNDEGVLPGATWSVAGMITRTELGLPIAYFYGFVTDGIFQNQSEIFQHVNRNGQLLQPNAKPGDVRFVDVNGDGRITNEDRTMIGNPTPKFTLGFNGSLEYKQFDMSFLIIGAFGHDIFNGMQRQDLSFTNRTTAMLDRWTGEGTSFKTPRYTWNDTNLNYRVSDLYIENGSFVRIKNIQLGYSLPVKALQKIKASNIRIYISAENLFTITGYTGADPEIGAMSSFDVGIDRGVYPQARSFRIGTTVSF